MKMRALIAFSVSLAAIGCASGGLVGEGPNRSIAQSAAQSAAQQHPQVVQEFGGAVDARTAAYVTDVGRRTAAQSGIQGAGQGVYTFTTLNSPVVNAFAVPGGYIYITRQLLGLMENEAELAFVLGHEVGHVAADHSRGRQNRGILTQLGALAVGVLTGSGELAQVAGQFGQGLFLSYSREQEYEADTLGIRYIAGAGYDANASAGILASLGTAEALDARVQGREDQRSVPSWARTHPLSEERVRRANAVASQLQRPAAGNLGRDQFLAAIDGLLWGDDPAQGVIEGRQFLHPDLRLAFTAPQGYGMQNGTRAVTIAGSNGQAQFSTGQFAGDLSGYIAQVYRGLVGQQAAQLQIPQPQTANVNGIPAAYTTTRVATQQGQLDVSVFAYRWDSNTAYHFVTITQAGAGLGPFASMVSSLRRLSAAEAAAIRPRVIDVVTVRAGDTLQSLANRMAYSDFKLERFLTLNSLQANSAVRPGDKVKIVVYGTRP
jgi:predicted Zn-dependent protease